MQSNPAHQDLNTKEAWAQGYTGKGVVVTILDDGIEKDHPDLISNYVSQNATKGKGASSIHPGTHWFWLMLVPGCGGQLWCKRWRLWSPAKIHTAKREQVILHKQKSGSVKLSCQSCRVQIFLFYFYFLTLLMLDFFRPISWQMWKRQRFFSVLLAERFPFGSQLKKVEKCWFWSFWHILPWSSFTFTTRFCSGS